MHRSLWADTAPPAPKHPPLSGDVDTDVVVVGAGYTGLSAALHLAEAGRDVVVLEAEQPGFGCSGRNGGQVNPAATRAAPSAVLAKLGRQRGERFLRFGERSADIVFELIERHAIDCEAVRPGYVQGGYGARGQRANVEWAREWQARGVDVRVLDATDIETLTGARGYAGGLLDPRGGSVQPLSYARGLARAARDAGATLHGDSRAVAVERAGAGWRVATPHGAVSAGNVLVATNGYTDALWPGLARAVVPVTSFVAATEPLGHNVLGRVLPGRHAVSESARVIVYYRRDAAGRFIIGGHGNWFDTAEEGRDRHVRAAAERLFPQLAGARWSHRWAGWPAMTRDGAPLFLRLAPGVHAGLGYNGRGVASGTLMGAELANVVLDAHEFLVEPQPLQSFTFHGLRQLAISWHLLSGSALDAVDRRA